MFTKYSHAGFRHSHHGHGHGHGHRGPTAGRRLLPYLAAAMLVRAALRHKSGHYGHGRWDHGPREWDADPAPHAPGERFRRGAWRHGRRHDSARVAPRDLRPEAGALMALLRDAFRHGGIDARQADEIHAVFSEAGRRIAAILGNTPTPTKMV